MGPVGFFFRYDRVGWNGWALTTLHYSLAFLSVSTPLVFLSGMLVRKKKEFIHFFLHRATGVCLGYSHTTNNLMLHIPSIPFTYRGRMHYAAPYVHTPYIIIIKIRSNMFPHYYYLFDIRSSLPLSPYSHSLSHVYPRIHHHPSKPSIHIFSHSHPEIKKKKGKFPHRHFVGCLSSSIQRYLTTYHPQSDPRVRSSPPPSRVKPCWKGRLNKREKKPAKFFFKSHCRAALSSFHYGITSPFNEEKSLEQPASLIIIICIIYYYPTFAFF